MPRTGTRRSTAELAGLRAEAGREQAAAGRRPGGVGPAHVELDHERRAAEERAAGLEETREQLTGEFARLSTDALQQNNEQFLQLADTKLNETRQAADGELAKRQEAIEQLLKPIGEQLGKYEEGMQRLEVERQRAYTTLTEQMKHLSTSHDQLQKETRNLVTALRSPQTRGRWGELQLRRVVEMAGMLEHCDFDEQVTSDADGGRLRPDMVVHLPGGKNVAVDAKVPMQAFLDANEADDETVRRTHLASHGRQMKAHVDALAEEGVLEAGRSVSRVRGGLHPRRSAADRRPRARARAHGVRGGQPRPAGHAHLAHRPAAGRGLRLAAGRPGRERPRGPARRGRALPAPVGAGRPRRRGGQGAEQRGRPPTTGRSARSRAGCWSPPGGSPRWAWSGSGRRNCPTRSRSTP